MTPEQKQRAYHRRLARMYGRNAILAISWNEDDPDYRGVGSSYHYAVQAAWHAFEAHPELRGNTITRALA